MSSHNISNCSNKPTSISSINDLHDFYWLKDELTTFCKQNKLSTQGIKSDLMQRIDVFLSTGARTKSAAVQKTAKKDSLNKLTRKTLVVNYNNDIETRKFFVTHIEKHFTFNAYLRQFKNKENIKPNMTYGDLVDGWILFEKNKKDNGARNSIPKQFEYNQFIKDYFSQEKEGTLKAAIKAWKFIKSRSGPNTYAQFMVTYKGEI